MNRSISAKTGRCVLTALFLAALAGCGSSSSGPVDGVSASADGGTCQWPTSAATVSDASGLGCSPQPAFNICEVPTGDTVEQDGTIRKPDGAIVTGTCTNACSSSQFALRCVGSMESFSIPEPDPSLKCIVIPGPTPSNESVYCCPCVRTFGDGGPDSVVSVDASVDIGALQVDGPTVCRAPSPDYGPTSVFAVLPNGAPAAATTCPAACGDSAWPQGTGTYPNIDIALPYGSCAPGTPSCSTDATVPCACAEESGGPADAFNCSCEGGIWICRIRFQGTALCIPCPDAGVDQMDQSPVSDGPQNVDEANQPGSDGKPDAYVVPTDEQTCLNATNVPQCSLATPGTSVSSATVGLSLTKVEVTAGSCVADTCASKCPTINVSGTASLNVGSTCDLLVTAADGRKQSCRLNVIVNPSPRYMCCGYPQPPYSGIWANILPMIFSPTPAIVDFAGDGGTPIIDGGGTRTPIIDGGGAPIIDCLSPSDIRRAE